MFSVRNRATVSNTTLKTKNNNGTRRIIECYRSTCFYKIQMVYKIDTKLKQQLDHLHTSSLSVEEHWHLVSSTIDNVAKQVPESTYI